MTQVIPYYFGVGSSLKIWKDSTRQVVLNDIIIGAKNSLQDLDLPPILEMEDNKLP